MDWSVVGARVEWFEEPQGGDLKGKGILDVRERTSRIKDEGMGMSKEAETLKEGRKEWE